MNIVESGTGTYQTTAVTVSVALSLSSGGGRTEAGTKDPQSTNTNQTLESAPQQQPNNKQKQFPAARIAENVQGDGAWAGDTRAIGARAQGG